jgi:hypothetical protein
MADYDKNVTLKARSSIEVNPKTGDIEFKYYKFSNSDTYDAIRRVHRAAAKYVSNVGNNDFNQHDFEKVLKEESAAFSSFLSPSLTASSAGALAGAPSANGSNGIYDPSNSTAENIGAAALEVGKSVIPKTVTDIVGLGNAIIGSGKDKYGAPDNPKDRALRLIGIPAYTMSLDKSIQFKVANDVKLIHSVNFNMKRTLSDYQTKGPGFWKDPESTKKILEDVQSSIEKSFKAQANIAETLHTAKQISYREKGSSEPIQITDRKLFEMLTEDNLRKIDKTIEYSLFKPLIAKGKAGVFVPPAELTPDEMRGLVKNGIPEATLRAVNQKLGYYKASSLPLLDVQPRKRTKE